MPYIMDDLDDLFREAGPAAQIHPPGLGERIDELRNLGCCEYAVMDAPNRSAC